MYISQSTTHNSELQARAEQFLALLKANFAPQKALIAIRDGEDWSSLTSFGLSKEGQWTESDLALGALEFAADNRCSRIFAHTAGALEDNPLAFLTGVPMHAVLVGYARLHDEELLIYLSRPFSDGLYSPKSLSEFERFLRNNLTEAQ